MTESRRGAVARFFSGVGTPALILLTMASVMVAGLDLVLPDPIPIIDEVFLLFVMITGVREMGRRGRARRLGGSTAAGAIIDVEADAIPRAAVPSRSVKTLLARAQAMADSASQVPGATQEVRSSARQLTTAVRSMLDELRENDAFEARRDNDPWQVDRRIAALETEVAELEAGGAVRTLEVRRKALEVARAHRTRIDFEGRRRGELLLRMESISAQVDLLANDLGALLAGRHDGDWQIRRAGELDPLIEVMVQGLGAGAEAEAEIEEAVRRARKPVGVLAL